MKFLTLPLVKQQLRIELDDETEDTTLSFYAAAAESVVSQHLNRQLYNDSVPDDESNGVILSEDITMAMLFVVSDFYENRSQSNDMTPHQLPVIVKQLLAPYRLINV